MIYSIHSMIYRSTIQAGHPGYCFIEIFGLYPLLLVRYLFFLWVCDQHLQVPQNRERESFVFFPFFFLSFRNLHILAIVDAISTTTQENIITFLQTSFYTLKFLSFYNNNFLLFVLISNRTRWLIFIWPSDLIGNVLYACRQRIFRLLFLSKFYLPDKSRHVISIGRQRK